MNVTVAKAAPEDRWDVLDFANFVFSQAHVPHDFRQLLPKMYGDDVDFTPFHYIAKEDHRIVGLTSALPYDVVCGEDRLRVGFVGTVSTHPYCRGKGYMKACMALLREDMEKSGAQLLVLGGQRQRYEHYGFSVGLPAVKHTVTKGNVQKALGGIDADNIRFEEEQGPCGDAVRLHESQSYYCVRDPARYVQFMRSWNRKFFRILRGDETLGFCAEGLSDIELYDPEDLLSVVKAWVLANGTAEISLGFTCTRWNEILSGLAEDSRAVNDHMLRVIDWPGCAEFFLKARARRIAPLEDGLFRLGVEGEGTLEMRVEGGVPRCRMTEASPDRVLDRIGAQELLFSIRSLYLPAGVHNWLPLPAWIPGQDSY